MNQSFLFIAIVFSWINLVSAQSLQPMTYQQARDLVAQPTPAISMALQSAPDVYTFKNNQNGESVSYTGQTFRQVLINDLKTVSGSMVRGEFAGDADKAYKTLDSFYSYQVDQIPVSPKAINGRSRHLTTVKNREIADIDVYEGVFYSSIYPTTTNLQVKTAGVDNKNMNQEILGWSTADVAGVTIDANGDGKKSPEEFIRATMRALANNAAATSKLVIDNKEISRASITQNGLDLAELLQKFLYGAVSFNQATSDYLSVGLGADKGLNVGNDSLEPNKPYTALAHHWDEAFGYFGAARDFLHYNDELISGGYSLDSFSGEFYAMAEGDEEISLEREKNFSPAVYIFRRQSLAADGAEQMATEAFSSFLNGRQLIHAKPGDYRRYAQAYGVIASVQWERGLMATAVHYLNEVLADYEKAGTANFDFVNLAHHFSEMKGLALVAQFSPVSPMSRAQFIKLHSLIGNQPVNPNQSDVSAHKAALEMARDLLRDVYEFSDSNVRNW